MKGCILPGGNFNSFQKWDSEMMQRGIRLTIHQLKTGGRIYLINDEDIEKLPEDEHGHYFGDAESGHSIYEITQEMVDDLIK
ncbi:MAG: hypothetical protein ACFFG0_00600 [Candidatus Thorarchaeota archaeon]